MIKVVLVTSYGHGCGTSELARNIVKYCIDPEIQITIEQRPIIQAEITKEKYDIVHLNESGHSCAGVTNEFIQELRSRGVKTLLTMNASHPENNWNPWTKSFDQVNIFEPRTTDGYNYVPLGAPVNDNTSGVPRQKLIGTNGFPQDRKNLFALAEACQSTGYSLRAYIPLSQHADSDAVASGIRERNPTAQCFTHWAKEEEIIRGFEECTAVAYPYIEWMYGASSATMFAVSARTPILVSRCIQFNFLNQRTDEVYFIESARPTTLDIIEAITKATADSFSKVPQTLYEEHRWDKVGERYAEVYKSFYPERVRGKSTRGETMKTGVKSLEILDYNEVYEEIDQLEWLTKEFRTQTPTARIDATDTIGHKHRMWEWARVLMLIKTTFGYPFDRKDPIEVLDIGTAYSLIGPALAYLGCNVLETDIDANAYLAERMKVKEFLNRFEPGGSFNWTQMGFGRIVELGKDRFDVVMSISTIEHVESSLEVGAWKEMYDALKPGGLLIVTMDCFEVAKKGYIYDDVRWTNYDMALVKTRVDELKGYGMKVIGDEDYKWHGVHVDDGSFAWLSLVKD